MLLSRLVSPGVASISRFEIFWCHPGITKSPLGTTLVGGIDASAVTGICAVAAGVTIGRLESGGIAAPMSPGSWYSQVRCLKELEEVYAVASLVEFLLRSLRLMDFTKAARSVSVSAASMIAEAYGVVYLMELLLR